MIMNTQNKISQLVLGLMATLGATEMVQAQNNTFTPGVSAITPTTQAIETGPLLDVVPYVLSDGYTINLTLIPSVTEFAGYTTPPDVANVTGGLNVVQLPVILPSFTVRQVITTVNVWDGQTVILGGLVTSQTQTEKDKVPVMGDLPIRRPPFSKSDENRRQKESDDFCDRDDCGSRRQPRSFRR